MKDRKRLFVAIEISKEAREHLRQFRDRLYDFPGKWTDIDNLHVTLSFLGNVNEGDIPTLIDGLQQAAESSIPFKLNIEKITFNSSDIKGEKMPKMIWADIAENNELQKLYKEVSRELTELPFFVHSQRPRFSPHITLCRFNSISIRKWHGEELPQINEDVSISFPVESIHLMESKLRRSGPEYFVLQSFTLGA